MEYTLATLEDTLGSLNPKDQEISNYLQTLPKERIVNIFQSLPPFIREEICKSNNSFENNVLKENLTEIGATTLIGSGVGYAIGGWGGAIVAGLVGGTAMYYYKSKM
jgi:hypothetical protein